jgi:hypothetical protein
MVKKSQLWLHIHVYKKNQYNEKHILNKTFQTKACKINKIVFLKK